MQGVKGGKKEEKLSEKQKGRYLSPKRFSQKKRRKGKSRLAWGKRRIPYL